MFQIFFLALFLTFFSFAEDFSKNAHITKINNVLKKYSSLKVGFRQTFKDETQEGSIFYKKNRGLYVEYTSSPLYILVNEGAVTYYDSKLDQKSQIPTKDSASSIFLGQLDINEKNFNIKNIQELDDAVIITANIPEKKDEGDFAMYFSKKDYILRRIDISSNDETVRIDLFSHNNTQVSDERFKSINIGKGL